MVTGLHGHILPMPPRHDHHHKQTMPTSPSGDSPRVSRLSPGSQDLNPEGPNAASGPNRYEYLRACLNRDGLAHNFAPDMASGEGRTGERFRKKLWYHGPGTVEIRSLLGFVVHLWRRGRRLRRKPDVLLSCPCTRESASILPQSATTQMGRIILRHRRSNLLT